jgi:hypothetical protein
MKNKNVIYTSIVGNYDKLHEPKIITPGWDYICFTDTDKTSDVWKINKIKLDPNLSNRKLSRKIKTLYHHFVKGYDVVIHVMGCSIININLNIISDLLISPYNMVALTHPYRDCVYDEAKEFIKSTGDPGGRIKKQIDFYKKEGMPKKYPLTACTMIVRKGNDKLVQKHCELWWEEILKYSPRDQISFPYICWKYNLINLRKWEFNNVYKYFIGTSFHNGGKRWLAKHSAD